MNDLLGVTVDDLVLSLKSRRIRIPSEIGAFVALATCEALMRGPAVVRGGDVRIAEDGVVSVFAPPNSASPEEAARSVCGILASLLVAAGTGVPSVLIQLVEQGPGTGAGALERLQQELESSLVPLNRAAARRVLSRMIREARRASIRPEAALHDVPADQLESQLEDQLDDLLGDGPGKSATPRSPHGESDPDLRPPPSFDDDVGVAPLSDPFVDPKRERHPVSVIPPPPATPRLTPSSTGRGAARAVEALDDRDRREEDRDELTAGAIDAREPDPISEPPPPRAARRPTPRADERREPAAKRADGQQRSTGSRKTAPGAAQRALDEFEPEPKTRGGGGGMFWALAFLVVALVGVAGVALLRPDLVDRALGRETPPEVPQGPTAEEQEAALRAHRARFGGLTVRSTPDRAQVLMFVGRGPAIASQLPTGMAYELVAIADGRVPTRAIVPADAQWEETPDGPRYELAMQAGDDPMALESLVLGDTRLPRDALGAPSATLGSIRVLTNPPGARVYLLVGFTPNVHVQNVRTDEIVELIVYREGHALERVNVAPSDWREAEDGSKTAEVDVTLRPNAPQRIR